MERNEARRRGLQFFSTGRECVNHHIAPRRTSNGRCMTCASEQQPKRASVTTLPLHNPQVPRTEPQRTMLRAMVNQSMAKKVKEAADYAGISRSRFLCEVLEAHISDEESGLYVPLSNEVMRLVRSIADDSNQTIRTTMRNLIASGIGTHLAQVQRS